MPWFRTKARKARDQLTVMEQSADDRLAAARAQHAAALAQRQRIDAVHKTTTQLRARNHWSSLVEEILGSGK